VLAALPASAQKPFPRDNTNRQRDQRQMEQAERRAQIQAERQAQRQQQMQQNGGVRLHGPGPHQGDWLREHQNLTPEQQEHALRSDPGFQKLPPERQQQLVNQLQRFSRMAPDQRQTMLQRMETWEHLTPEQRQQARMVWDHFRQLPDDRRAAVHQAYQRLMNMPPDQRQRLLSSEQFRGRFSDPEREIITGSLNFGIPAGGLGPNQTAPPPRLRQPGQGQASPQQIPPQR
jgi:hypothetical protein